MQNIHVHLEKADFGQFFFPKLLIVHKYFHPGCQYHAWSIFPNPPSRPSTTTRTSATTADTLLSCVSQCRVFFDKLDASQTLRTASTCILKSVRNRSRYGFHSSNSPSLSLLYMRLCRQNLLLFSLKARKNFVFFVLSCQNAFVNLFSQVLVANSCHGRREDFGSKRFVSCNMSCSCVVCSHNTSGVSGP